MIKKMIRKKILGEVKIYSDRWSIRLDKSIGDIKEDYDNSNIDPEMENEAFVEWNSECCDTYVNDIWLCVDCKEYC